MRQIRQAWCRSTRSARRQLRRTATYVSGQRGKERYATLHYVLRYSFVLLSSRRNFVLLG